MQIIINIIISASIYLLIAQSFKFLYETSKFIVISHAICITLSGYLYFQFAHDSSFSPIVSFLLSNSIVVLYSLITYLGIYAPLLKKNTEPFLVLISSLGVYVIFENIIKILWGDSTKSIDPVIRNQSFSIFDAYITSTQIILIVASIFLVGFSIFFLNKSIYGQQIKAIASNPDLAEIYGINKKKIILLAFSLGAILAGIIGILLAIDINLKPSIGFNYLLYGIVALIIGGLGSTKGLIGGAIMLSAAQHIGAYCLSSSWMDAIAYIFLVLFLVIRPFGFSGNRLKKNRI